MPDSVTFRDGDLVRPVAPFYEIWARVGDAGGALREVPLTPALLQANGLALAALQMKVTAQNLKAARRTGNRQLAFGTFPPLSISASNHSRIAILGTSPTTAPTPMIPAGRSIPLGSVQFVRSIPQPANEPWSAFVNVETIRFRYTPGTGAVLRSAGSRAGDPAKRAAGAGRPSRECLSQPECRLARRGNDRPGRARRHL